MRTSGRQASSGRTKRSWTGRSGLDCVLILGATRCAFESDPWSPIFLVLLGVEVELRFLQLGLPLRLGRLTMASPYRRAQCRQ